MRVLQTNYCYQDINNSVQQEIFKIKFDKLYHTVYKYFYSRINQL